MLRLFPLLSVAFPFLFTAQPAHAATVDFGWLVTLTSPYVETLFIALAAAIAGWLLSRLNRWIGLEIDRDHAEALHAALARGVRQAVSLVREELKQHTNMNVESRLVAETAIYMEQLMPDALDHFGLTDESLDRLIRAHIGPDLLHWAQSESGTAKTVQDNG